MLTSAKDRNIFEQFARFLQHWQRSLVGAESKPGKMFIGTHLMFIGTHSMFIGTPSMFIGTHSLINGGSC